MNGQKIEILCKELGANKGWPRDIEAFEKVWTPIKETLVTPDEQVTLLKCLAKREGYIFRWLGLFSWLIPKLGSDDQVFVEFLEEIVAKVKGDMAQGDFIRSLIRLGEEKPDQGTALYSRIIETSGDIMIHYSGLLLGGAAKASHSDALLKMEDGLTNEKPAIVVACLRALRVSLEGSEELTYPWIFDILSNLTKSPDAYILREVVNAYIDFDRFDSDTCGSKLLEIALSAKSDMRFTILSRLLVVDLQNKSNEIEILKTCSRDSDADVLDQISYVLARKGQTFLEDALEIIKEWMKRRKYYEIRSLDYCLSELGKNRLSECVKIIEAWIDSDKDPVFQSEIPLILCNISSSNFDELLITFEQGIPKKSDDYKKIVIQTIADILDSLHHPPESTIRRCFSILRQLNGESTRSDLVSGLVSIFGSRPLFTDAETIIKIVSEWASDSDWEIRVTSLVPLVQLAEYKIDSEETVQLLINKDTGETSIGAIRSKKVEHIEGVKAYELLKKLTADEKEEVRTQARGVLFDIDSRLAEKEKRINGATKSDK